MGGTVSMRMRVAVPAVLVRMCMLVIVLVDLVFVVCSCDFAIVFCAHFYASVQLFSVVIIPAKMPALLPAGRRGFHDPAASEMVSGARFSYPSILNKYVVFLKVLQPYMGVIFICKYLV